LAFVLTCNEGPRISNLTPPDGKKGEDHRCIEKDLVFTLAGGDQIAAGTEGTVARLAVPNDVSSACLTYVSSKPGKAKVKGGEEKKAIMRRSPEEGHLLDDLNEWVLHADLASDDRLFVVKMGKSLQLRAKDIRSGIKESAKRCGVLPCHFSTGRKFFATQMSLARDPPAEIRAVGGLSAESTVPETHYSRASSLRGSLAMLADPNAPRLKRSDIMQLLPFVDGTGCSSGFGGGKNT